MPWLWSCIGFPLDPIISTIKAKNPGRPQHTHLSPHLVSSVQNKCPTDDRCCHKAGSVCSFVLYIVGAKGKVNMTRGVIKKLKLNRKHRRDAIMWLDIMTRMCADSSTYFHSMLLFVSHSQSVAESEHCTAAYDKHKEGYATLDPILEKYILPVMG